MVTYEGTKDTLDRVCENLTIIAGQLYLGSIEPCMAKVQIESVKSLQDSTIDGLRLWCRYPLTDTQKERIDKQVNRNNKYFGIVEKLINIKQAEKDAIKQASKVDTTQAQPE